MLKRLRKIFMQQVVKEVVADIPVLQTKHAPYDILIDSPHRPRKEQMTGPFHIEPGVGAVVYCQLLSAEHSGIYLGNGRIAQLSGTGKIEEVSLACFTNNITTFDKDIFIPVDSFGCAISFEEAATHAKKMLDSTRSYHFLYDNCHQFSSGCLTDNFENDANFLWMVKSAFTEATNKHVHWQRWEWYK